MAEDWFTIVLRLALYLDMAAAFGVAMFGVYALGHDERSLAIARSYRVCVGAFAAFGIGLSVIGMTVLAKAMSGAQTYSELSTHIFEMLITGTHMGLAWCIRILALALCILIALVKFNPTFRFVAMSVSSGVALATLAWAGHGAMDDGMRGYIHLASDISTSGQQVHGSVRCSPLILAVRGECDTGHSSHIEPYIKRLRP
jgi:putative copper resistance protein D